jgi:glycerate-2-kinase
MNDSGWPIDTPVLIQSGVYTTVGLKTEVLGGSTRERNFSFQTELSIDEEKIEERTIVD